MLLFNIAVMVLVNLTVSKRVKKINKIEELLTFWKYSVEIASVVWPKTMRDCFHRIQELPRE